MALVLGGATVTAGLSGCASNNDDPTVGWSPERLFSEARSAMNAGQTDKAVGYFEKIEARYPSSPFTQQAQLELAYGYYKQREALLSVQAADRFIKLHPGSEAVDYAYYLKGLANFNDNLGMFGKFFGEDLSERDQQAAQDSFAAFKELIEKFPNSKYSEDARSRMAYLVNVMAGNELHVARFYYRRGAFVAAVNRAQNVVREFQQAPQVEEALYLMASSYQSLGLTQLRDDTLRVLRTNFPSSSYLSQFQQAG